MDKQEIRDNLYRHVETLSDRIGERHLWRDSSLEKAEDYIESVLRASRYAVERQEVAAFGMTRHNLIAEKPGSEQGVVVIGAHYDTVPGSPGADDNASGVAVLLELARLLRDDSPRRTILLAAFVNEESPCCGTAKMGSMVYAKHLRERNVPVEVMISLEMLGCFRREKIQRYPFPFLRRFYPETADFLAVLGNCVSWRHALGIARGIRRHAALRVRSLVMPEHVGGVNRSDNASFWHYGFKAVMLTDTSNFRNEHYHQETDTVDTLDYGAMTEIARGVHQAVKGL